MIIFEIKINGFRNDIIKVENNFDPNHKKAKRYLKIITKK